MSELLPCPFCGEEVQRTDCEHVSHWNTFYCDRCPVEFSIPHHATADAYTRLWNTRPKPRLPRVSPEGLVEWRWYVVPWGETETYMQFKNGLLGALSSDFDPSEFSAIWGPVPDHELEQL